MGRVADALNDWAETYEPKWPRREAALAWAERHGDDLEAAWEQCQRADDLRAIAGALQPPLQRAVVMAGRVMRPSLALVAKKDALATRAVYLAETWGAGNAKAAAMATEQLEAYVRRTGARYLDGQQRLAQASVEAVGAMAKSEVQAHGERLRALAVAGDAPWIDAEVERALAEPATQKALREFGAKIRAAQSEMARVTALSGALELAHAVGSAHAALKAFATLTQLEDDERARLDDELVNQLSTSAVKAEAGVYGLLASALGLAAEAHGRDAVGRAAGGDDGAFTRALAVTVFQTVEHALRRSHEPVTALAMHAEMERRIEAGRAAKHREMADTIRGEIPFAALAQRRRYAA